MSPKNDYFGLSVSWRENYSSFEYREKNVSGRITSNDLAIPQNKNPAGKTVKQA
jgi:hypothetical protein